MKTQTLNYDTAKNILDGFRYVGCKFLPHFYNKYGMLAFNPKEWHTVIVDISDPEKGLISFLQVTYRTFCRLFPKQRRSRTVRRISRTVYRQKPDRDRTAPESHQTGERLQAV